MSANQANLVSIDSAGFDDRESTLVEIIGAVSEGNYLVDTDDSSHVGQAVQKLILQLRCSGSIDLERIVKMSMCSNEASISSAKLLFDLRQVDRKAQSIATASEQIQSAISEINSYSQEIKRITLARSRWSVMFPLL